MFVERKQAAIHAMNAYNRLSPSDVTQAAYTGKATMLTSFDTAAAVTSVHADQKRELARWKVDMEICLEVLGITDGQIAGDNTADAFRDRLIAFNTELTRSFFSGQHLQC